MHALARTVPILVLVPMLMPTSLPERLSNDIAARPCVVASVQPFTHDFETLSMFQRLGLTAPSTPADVEATLEALQQKKAYFTTLPPKETKADKKSSPTYDCIACADCASRLSLR
jgi:hypothetical protein